ncbi:MAG: hypothetical protein FWH40_10030, partial [Coriobacteriia bacterium]|nr:hypothetical protein [Coriobacteriia bacterium]
MTDDNAKDKKLYEKSRQIETSKARINSLSGEVSMLEQRLADLERLLALTTDAFAAYSYGASRIDDRLSLLSSLRETVISAAGAQNLLSEALTGTPVRRAAYQAEDGIGLLR